MKSDKTLFDDISPKKEATALERVKNLDAKISGAIEKVKMLKEEKTALERRIRELEGLLDKKNEEIEMLKSDKVTIKAQIEDLLNELETIETGQ
jgi:chromosome segregation ATPase